MTTKYCRPIDGGAAIDYAPDFIVNPDGSINHAPSRADYAAKEWWLNAIIAPYPPEGMVVASTRYEVRGEGAAAEVVAVYEYEPAPVIPRKFSKLKIYGTISMLPPINDETAWAKIEAWLRGKEVNGVNGWMAFQLAQEISEDHPLFAAWADEARQILGLSVEQFDALLAACVLEA